ncbi:MAG TPA: MlaD family protein [Candidatus Binataceae bacterium]|nr:MlaD family protein [Candidatus Binataceae bacterium]
MAKRTNPATVGAFVIGGIVLVAALVIIVGSGKWFTKQDRFVCFFTGDLNGLNVGAAVKFRGVKIGSVVSILVNLPGRTPKHAITAERAEKLRLPVIIELDEKQVTALGARGDITAGNGLQQLINVGLRARLGTESLLTGLLYVDLNFFPGTPAKLILHANDKEYREIPTLPTQFEQIQEAAMRGLGKLDQIDFPALISSLTEAAQSARDFVSSSQLKAAVVSLGNAAGSLSNTSQATRETLAKLSNNLDPLIVSLRKTSDSLRKTSDSATATMRGAQTTLVNLQQVVDPDSPLMYQLSQAAGRLGEASLAMRDLASDLDRNPSILVRGRAQSDQSQ